MRFRTKRPDGRAEWRVIFELVREGEPDTVFPYEMLGQALDITDRQRIQQATRQANKHLWKASNRSLKNIPNVGYRILRAQEHEDQATDYHQRSRKQMRSAVQVIEATDLAQLNNSERTRVLEVASIFIRMAKAIDYHGRQLAHHDQLIRDLESRIERLEQPQS